MAAPDDEEKHYYTFFLYGSTAPVRYESTTDFLAQHTEHLRKWMKTGELVPLVLHDDEDGHVATWDPRAIQGVTKGAIPSPKEMRAHLDGIARRQKTP